MPLPNHQEDSMVQKRAEIAAEFTGLVTELITINLETMKREAKHALLKKISEHVSQYLQLANDNNFRFRLRGQQQYCNQLEEGKKQVERSTNHNTQSEIDCFKEAINCFEKISQCYYDDNKDDNIAPSPHQAFIICHNAINTLQKKIHELIPNSPQSFIDNISPPQRSETTVSSSPQQSYSSTCSPASSHLHTRSSIVTTPLTIASPKLFSHTSPSISISSSTTSAQSQNTRLTQAQQDNLINKLKAYYDPDKFSFLRFPIASDRKKCVADLINSILKNQSQDKLLALIFEAQKKIAYDDYQSDFGVGVENVAQLPKQSFFTIARNQAGSRLMTVLNDIVKDLVTQQKKEATISLQDSEIKPIQQLLNVIFNRACNLVGSGKALPKEYNNIPFTISKTEDLKDIKKKLDGNIKAFDNSIYRANYQVGLINLMKSTVQLLNILIEKPNLAASNRPKI